MARPEGSIGFDRAAEFYDHTRGISAEAMARNVELLSAELAGRAPVLEVGVGTGLVALPLLEAGVPVIGLDLSPAMVAKLVAKAGAARVRAVLGDAARTPFRDSSFAAAYLRWVLHLIPDWRGALGEVARVVRPGGVFLANLGAYGGPQAEIQERFGRITGISIEPVGLRWGDFRSLDAEMARHGAAPRELPLLHDGREERLEEFVEGIVDNRYSWTWRMPHEVRLQAARELRPWAEERFGSLDRVRLIERPTRWRAYDLPGSTDR
jgi:SAM-dependent methyltransferase